MDNHLRMNEFVFDSCYRDSYIPFRLNYAMQIFTYFFENRGVNDVTLTSSTGTGQYGGTSYV